jgi:hypothetical protein
MSLNLLKSITSTTDVDPAYIAEVRAQFIAAGIIPSRVDEGVADLARKIGSGIKRFTARLINKLFLSKDAKQVGKVMDEAIKKGIEKANQKISALNVDKRTNKVMLDTAVTSIVGELGSEALKLFKFTPTTDGLGIFMHENPRIIHADRAPLLKIFIEHPEGDAAHHAGAEDFYHVTYDKTFDRRIFALIDVFHENQGGRIEHDDKNESHPHAPTAGTQSTSAAVSSTEPAHELPKEPEAHGSEETGGSDNKEVSVASTAEKPEVKPEENPDEKPEAEPTTWAGYKSKGLSPKNAGTPDVKPGVSTQAAQHIANDFLSTMLEDWQKFIEHGFTIDVRRKQDIKRLTSMINNLMAENLDVNTRKRYIAEIKSMIDKIRLFEILSKK